MQLYPQPNLAQLSKPFTVLLWILILCGLSSLVRADELDDYVRLQMRTRKIPGLSLAIIQGGKVIRTQGYGFRDKAHRWPVTPSTLFQAGSTSKAVAAVGALKLVDQGRISLDSDANTWLRTWKVPESSFTVNHKVTLRGLLSHTAGVSVHGFPGYEVGQSVPTLVQVLNGVNPARSQPILVEAEPGSGWSYSGGGYTVMQQIVLDVTGKSFPNFMQEAVLGPLDMMNSTFEQHLPDNLAHDAATGFNKDGNEVAGRWRIYPEMAAAGLWTTPTDLAKFAIGIQHALTGQPGSLISQRLAGQMVTAQKADYGLGVFLEDQPPFLRFYHTGRVAGFDSSFVAYATGGLGAVVMVNTNEDAGIVGRVLMAIGHQYHWPNYPHLAKLPNPIVRVDRVAMAKDAGIYNYGDGPFAVSLGRGELIGTYLGEYVDDFLPISAEKFFMRDVGHTVSFDRNSKSKVIAMRWIEKNGNEHVFPRLFPDLHAAKVAPDPNGALTARIRSTLEIVSRGGAEVANDAFLTSGAKKALRNGATDLAGIGSLEYVGEELVSDRNIVRQGSPVSRVLGYRLNKGHFSGGILIFLTTEDLLTDFDIVN